MLLNFLTLLNVFFAAALWHLERNVAENRWFATFITYAPQHPVILPSLFLMLCALVSRRFRALIFNTALAAFCMVVFLGYSVALHLPTKHSGKSLRILTYNIHHGSKGVDKIIHVARAKNPDVVCLQEANSYKSWSDPMPEIKKQFKDWHIAQSSDLAILSRFPMTTRVYNFPVKTRRVILEGILNIKGNRLAVFNVHFATAIGPQWLLTSRESLDDYLEETASVRMVQFDTLIKIAEKTRAVFPVVIAGDFNTPPRGKFYMEMAKHFHDAFRKAGRGFGYTFRSDVPLLRIDYVFLDKRLEAESAFVVDSHASDHRPLVADVMFPEK